MKPKLTVKQAKFVKAVAEGKPKYVAAMEAYDTTDPATASTIAKENLRKTSVLEALHAELERQGITLEKIIKPVARALEADDVDTQLKGHDRAVRLIMPRQQDGGTTNYNFINVAKADKEAFDI